MQKPLYMSSLTVLLNLTPSAGSADHTQQAASSDRTDCLAEAVSAAMRRAVAGESIKGHDLALYAAFVCCMLSHLRQLASSMVRNVMQLLYAMFSLLCMCSSHRILGNEFACLAWPS